jgi:predicted transcriptional regulator
VDLHEEIATHTLDDSTLSGFRNLGAGDKAAYNELGLLRHRILWVLAVARAKFAITALSAREIERIMVEALLDSVRQASIINSMKATRGLVHKTAVKGVMRYMIMQKGIEAIETGHQGRVEVHAFEAGKPHTAKRELAGKVLGSLGGVVRVVDPWCGIGLVNMLVDSGISQAHVLTVVDIKQKDAKRLVSDMPAIKHEHPGILIRSCTSGTLHDRYVLSKDAVVLLGQSIKDIGRKESFAVVLPRRSFADLYDSLLQGFEDKWSAASPVT